MAPLWKGYSRMSAELTELAKAAPPVAVVGASLTPLPGWVEAIAGFPLDSFAYLTTIVYTVIMTYVLIRDRIIRNQECRPYSNGG